MMTRVRANAISHTHTERTPIGCLPQMVFSVDARYLRHALRSWASISCQHSHTPPEVEYAVVSAVNMAWRLMRPVWRRYRHALVIQGLYALPNLARRFVIVLEPEPRAPVAKVGANDEKVGWVIQIRCQQPGLKASNRRKHVASVITVWEPAPLATVLYHHLLAKPFLGLAACGAH